MKLRWKVFIGVIIICVIGFGILSYLNRPISEEVGREMLQNHINSLVEKNDVLSSVLFTIHSDNTDFHFQYAAGTKSMSSNDSVQTDSQYHSASVGKVMNATVFGMLVDEGIISYNDKIKDWLDQDILKDLFVFDGKDFSNEVTIRHLLTHTSGVACYYEDPVEDGRMFMEIVADNLDMQFTPEKLLAFTRDNQKAVGKPGDQFHYSDTSYILLGLILEEIEGESYSDILNKRIFTPLGMNNTYLMFYQDEPADILGIYVDGIDFSETKVLSLDWAGGGIVSTMDDLLTFMKALGNGKLVSDGVYQQMTDFSLKYEKGIYYGMGMMYFDFSELSFLLGSMTNVYGGMGSTGAYMFYDKEENTYYIANFGSNDFSEGSIQELIRIRLIYNRIKT